MKVYERITDLIGHTPLLKLNHLIAEKELQEQSVTVEGAAVAAEA